MFAHCLYDPRQVPSATKGIGEVPAAAPDRVTHRVGCLSHGARARRKAVEIVNIGSHSSKATEHFTFTRTIRLRYGTLVTLAKLSDALNVSARQSGCPPAFRKRYRRTCAPKATRRRSTQGPPFHPGHPRILISLVAQRVKPRLRHGHRGFHHVAHEPSSNPRRTTPHGAQPSATEPGVFALAPWRHHAQPPVSRDGRFHVSRFNNPYL